MRPLIKCIACTVVHRELSTQTCRHRSRAPDSRRSVLTFPAFVSRQHANAIQTVKQHLHLVASCIFWNYRDADIMRRRCYFRFVSISLSFCVHCVMQRKAVAVCVSWFRHFPLHFMPMKRTRKKKQQRMDEFPVQTLSAAFAATNSHQLLRCGRCAC